MSAAAPATQLPAGMCPFQCYNEYLGKMTRCVLPTLHNQVIQIHRLVLNMMANSFIFDT